jgi:IclR family acetate operon transcriptional repressor
MSGEVRSVTQAFSILRLLADTEPLTLSETARLAGLGPSTCFNLLKTLLSEGAIVRDQPSKKYHLSPTWSKSELFRDSMAHRLIEKMRPLMARFAQSHDLTIGLWQIAPKERLQLVAHAESDAQMSIRLANHQRQPLGSGAVGRAFAAAQNPETSEIQRRFGAVRWQKDISFSEYHGQIRAAATQGFAIDNGYAHVGITSVAAVIPAAPVSFALSVSFFAGARSAEGISALGEALKNLAES